MEKIREILVNKETIQKRVKELGREISSEYEGKNLILIGVLKGGFVFLADLMRAITIPVYIDFISVSSYGNATASSGIVKINKDVDTDITNKHIVLVEDIVDTGLTLKYLAEFLKTREPLSIKVCTALDKPSRRKVDVKIDYKGIEIPDEFVVGYGLDFSDRYRNLPDVNILDC